MMPLMLAETPLSSLIKTILADAFGQWNWSVMASKQTVVLIVSISNSPSG